MYINRFGVTVKVQIYELEEHKIETWRGKPILNQTYLHIWPLCLTVPYIILFTLSLQNYISRTPSNLWSAYRPTPGTGLNGPVGSEVPESLSL